MTRVPPLPPISVGGKNLKHFLYQCYWNSLKKVIFCEAISWEQCFTNICCDSYLHKISNSAPLDFWSSCLFSCNFWRFFFLNKTKQKQTNKQTNEIKGWGGISDWLEGSLFSPFPPDLCSFILLPFFIWGKRSWEGMIQLQTRPWACYCGPKFYSLFGKLGTRLTSSPTSRPHFTNKKHCLFSFFFFFYFLAILVHDGWPLLPVCITFSNLPIS